MSNAAVVARLIAIAALGLAAPLSLAQAPPPGKAARPAAQKPVVVPADVRAKVVSRLQGAKADDVTATPIPGLYEVTMGGVIAYVTGDGKYLVSGNVYDLETQANLTAARRSAARAKALAVAPESKMIVFSPPNPKMTVTVFTDIDCSFCRKFHGQIAEMNKAGVRVRYLMYPRTGPGTESWRKAEAVWCSADRRDALTRAKRGEEIKAGNCPGGSAIMDQYMLGDDLGVEGTPAVFTESGDYIGGFMTPPQLVQAIKETQLANAVKP